MKSAKIQQRLNCQTNKPAMQGISLLDFQKIIDRTLKMQYKPILEIIADMEQYFDEVIQAEYIGYDEAHYALVSAAVIDSVINSFVYRCDEEDYFEWTSSQKCFDFSPLKQKAVTAIGAILSDNSELRELWEENEELYEAWKEDKLSMQKRLQQ